MLEHSTGPEAIKPPWLQVVVPQGSDDSGLFPIGVLDPEAAFAVRGVHYFDAFISYLEVRWRHCTAGTSLCSSRRPGCTPWHFRFTRDTRA